MRPLPRILALATLLGLATLTAHAQPTYWRVTGVAPDDTLNVRARADASSEDIGDLPHDAAGVEIGGTDPTGKWGWIVWGEGNGWVAMRFLAPDPQPVIAGTEVPAGLMCGGTEPFWSVRYSVDSAVYFDVSGQTLQLGLSGARVADGRMSFPVKIDYSSPATNAAASVILRGQNCSDGMSDRIYPWTVSLMINAPQGFGFLDGCCHLPLEAGSH